MSISHWLTDSYYLRDHLPSVKLIKRRHKFEFHKKENNIMLFFSSSKFEQAVKIFPFTNFVGKEYMAVHEYIYLNIATFQQSHCKCYFVIIDSVQ